MAEKKFNLKSILAGAAAAAVVAFGMFVMPMYRVWQQNQEGKAELARAEQNRQIAVQEALRETKGEVIYIPTEAGIPITEAGNRKRRQDNE